MVEQLSCKQQVTGSTPVSGSTQTGRSRRLQATQLLDAGIPLRSVSGRVGHSNPSTTTNIYAHWTQESDSCAASAVDDRIWGVGG